MGFQHWRLINQVQAKEFINPGGPPVFKLHFFGGGSGGWLIRRGWLILTWHIYIYYAIMLCIFGGWTSIYFWILTHSQGFAMWPPGGARFNPLSYGSRQVRYRGWSCCLDWVILGIGHIWEQPVVGFWREIKWWFGPFVFFFCSIVSHLFDEVHLHLDCDLGSGWTWALGYLYPNIPQWG